MQAVKWHSQHKVEETTPARQLERLREQLAKLQSRLTILVGA